MALGKMPITERIAKKVAAYLNDPDHEVRNAGCQALSNMGPLCTDEYVDAINRLRESDSQVRDAAERALRTLAKQDGKRQHGDGELRSYIAALLKDPSVAQDPRWQAEKAKREAREKDKGTGKGKGHWGKGEDVSWKGEAGSAREGQGHRQGQRALGQGRGRLLERRSGKRARRTRAQARAKGTGARA